MLSESEFSARSLNPVNYSNKPKVKTIDQSEPSRNQVHNQIQMRTIEKAIEINNFLKKSFE